ncbi:auxin-responsive protein SAUR64-like [Cornus florida]|uniref:auxin-responsive protein SAUR64-like n=1 Tax=Cornus florida TaxID=4283 RepID=UPI00289E289D|nr:auxin-responsive protein SAUR64-like [Cornus florida]
MIGPKKIIKMARNWQKQAVFSQKRITFLKTSEAADGKSCKASTVNKGHFVVYTAESSRTSLLRGGREFCIQVPTKMWIQMVADRGHFIVYKTDQRGFEVPLAYLGEEIFRKLLEMSEEEFGLPSEGPIRVPCNALFMEYIM